MEHDDVQVGRILSRREVLTLLGAGEAAALATPRTTSAGALVDVWQCDAEGAYSSVKDINDRFDTTGQRFLRGHQVTDRDGIARFTTIYRGWYRGRTVHIHFMIRTSPGDDVGEEFASQSGRRTRNPEDGIYRSGGSQLLLDVTEDEGMYRAIFDIGLQDG